MKQQDPIDLVTGTVLNKPGVIYFKDKSGTVIYVGHTKSVEDYLYNLTVRLQWIWGQLSPDTATIDPKYTPTVREAAALAARARRHYSPQHNSIPQLTTIRTRVPVGIANRARAAATRSGLGFSSWLAGLICREVAD